MIRSRSAVAVAASLLVLSAVMALPAFGQTPSAPPAIAPATAPGVSAAPSPTCVPLPTLAPPAAVPASPDAGTADEPDLTVFAAASLTGAFNDLSGPWTAAHPGLLAGPLL